MRERVQRARRLRAEGYRPAHLAAALGISRQAVYGGLSPVRIPSES